LVVLYKRLFALGRSAIVPEDLGDPVLRKPPEPLAPPTSPAMRICRLNSLSSHDPGGGHVRTLLRRLTRPPIRTWAAAGAALVSAYMLALVYWNLPDLVVLQDHPLPPLVFWPAVWLLLAVAVTLLIPSGRRGRLATALAFGATGLVVLVCGGGFGLALSYTADGGPFGRGDPIDRLSSADGQYEVQIFQWQTVIGEIGWDIVIQRRDGVEADAGCLWSEGSADYQEILAVEAGFVRIATDEGSVFIAFDPNTMQVTRGVHECGGYEGD
jgi:hypothetical protein